MSKSKRIYDWQEWVEICEKAGVNPHENADCGFDEGMGNSDNYEYRGKYPEVEWEKLHQNIEKFCEALRKASVSAKEAAENLRRYIENGGVRLEDLRKKEKEG